MNSCGKQNTVTPDTSYPPDYVHFISLTRSQHCRHWCDITIAFNTFFARNNGEAFPSFDSRKRYAFVI